MSSTARNETLHAQLAALGSDALAAPIFDPRIAALVGIACVDHASSEPGAARFAALVELGGCEPTLIASLDHLSHALLAAVERLDAAPRKPAAVMLAPALDGASAQVREELLQVASRHISNDPASARLLAQIRLGYGPLDRAQDLRRLADLVEAHRAAFEAVDAWDVDLVATGRECAREIDLALFAHDTPQLRDARVQVARIWTPFALAYEEVARLGRDLFADDNPHGRFPELSGIAHWSRGPRRARSSRSSRSLRAVRAPIVDDAPRISSSDRAATNLEAVDAPVAVPSAPRVADDSPRDAPSASTTASAASPSDRVGSDAPEIEVRGELSSLDAGIADIAELARFDAAAAAREDDDAPLLEVVAEARHEFRVDLSATSDSTLYIGLSDRVDDAGIFVATYATLPADSEVRLWVTIGDAPDPILIDGAVHWVRPKAAWDTYLPSGMGIALEPLSPAARAGLEYLLGVRTPLFYDD